MTKTIWTFAAVLFLAAGVAGAQEHCADDLSAAEDALATSVEASDNALDAAEALIDAAIAACEAEEAAMDAAEYDDPILDADHVTVGQSMLINAAELAAE